MPRSLQALARGIGRPARQRTTLYGIPGEAPSSRAAPIRFAAEPRASATAG